MKSDLLKCPPADRLLHASTQNLLAHYTTSSGMLGIIKEKGIWATHSEFLNDSSESTHYIELAKNCIDIRLASGCVSADERILLSLFRRPNPWRYYSDTRGYRVNVFIVSFSEEADLLSQWRAYCLNGGYSISFSLEHLRAVGRSQGFYVARCEYDDASKKAIIESLVDSALSEYRRLLAINGTTPNPEPSQSSIEAEVIALYERSLAYYGPLLKHSSFKEEKEWRAVLGPVPVALAYCSDESAVTQTWNKLKFRARNGALIPYCEFRFDTDEYPLTNRVVVTVGPSRTNDRGVLLMQEYFRRTFGDSTRYVVSQIPFDPL